MAESPGAGLLRFRSQHLYGRVMASRESGKSRAQVRAIARSDERFGLGTSRLSEITLKRVGWGQDALV